MTGYAIIKAQDGHVPGIVEIWKEFRDYHKELNPFHTRREGAHLSWEKFLKKMIESDDALVLVALSDDSVVGYSIARIQEYPPLFQHDKYGFISDMAVIAGQRRRRRGEKMLSMIFEWFDENHVKRVELRVEPSNPIGYSFWRKHGFKEHVHTLSLER